MPWLDVATGQFKDDDGCVIPDPSDEDISKEGGLFKRYEGGPKTREDEEEEEEDESAPLNLPHILHGKSAEKFEGRIFVKDLFNAVNKAKEDLRRPPEPPEPYYWEDGYDRKERNGMTTWAKIKQGVHWIGSGVISGASYVGDVVVHFLGMDQPYHQWAVEQVEREEEERRIEALRRERADEVRAVRRREKLKAIVDEDDALLRKSTSEMEVAGASAESRRPSRSLGL